VESVQHEKGHTNDNPAPQLNLEAVAAQAMGLLEQVPVADGIGAKLSRVLHSFFLSDVLSQARRAANQGIDPTPLFAVTADVLRLYADAVHPPDVAECRRVRY
jgi:hypothetical protein